VQQTAIRQSVACRQTSAHGCQLGLTDAEQPARRAAQQVSHWCWSCACSLDMGHPTRRLRGHAPAQEVFENPASIIDSVSEQGPTNLPYGCMRSPEHLCAIKNRTAQLKIGLRNKKSYGGPGAPK
jgi:hypothetical protein